MEKKYPHLLMIRIGMQMTEWQPTEKGPGVNVDTKLNINQLCASTMSKATTAA